MENKSKGIALIAVNSALVALMAIAVVWGPFGGESGRRRKGLGANGSAADRSADLAIDPAAGGMTGANGAGAFLSNASMAGPVDGSPDASPALVTAATSASDRAGAPPAAREANTRGIASYEAGRYDEAVDHFERALAAAPGDSAVTSNLAYALANGAIRAASVEDGTKLDGALADLDRALSLAPANHDFLRAQGELRFRKGDLRGARSALLDASLARADDPIVERTLGEIAYREERLREALERFRRAVRLGDRDPRLAERIAKVEREAGVEDEMGLVRGRNFAVKYESDAVGTEGEAEVVLRTLERIRGRIGREIDYFPHATISVVLYDGEEFRGVTGAHDWTGGIFDGKIRVPLRGLAANGAATERILAHEYAHALVNELAGRRAPAWLDEGIAQRVAGEWSDERGRDAAERFRASFLVPLELLESSFGTIAGRDEAERAYFEAYVAVDYLAYRYGPRSLKSFLAALAGGSTIPTALQGVYAIDYRRLNDEVEAHLERKFPSD